MYHTALRLGQGNLCPHLNHLVLLPLWRKLEDERSAWKPSGEDRVLDAIGLLDRSTKLTRSLLIRIFIRLCYDKGRTVPGNMPRRKFQHQWMGSNALRIQKAWWMSWKWEKWEVIVWRLGVGSNSRHAQQCMLDAAWALMHRNAACCWDNPLFSLFSCSSSNGWQWALIWQS